MLAWSPAHTHDACTYLWQLHEAGKLELDFEPLNLTLGYHMPCHLRALEVGSPGEDLLRLIQASPCGGSNAAAAAWRARSASNAKTTAPACVPAGG